MMPTSGIITIPEMGQALRLSTDSEALDSTIVEILARMMVTGLDAIEVFAPTAPATTKAESLIRFCKHLFDNPEDSNPFVQSGARALLSSWHIPEGVTV